MRARQRGFTLVELMISLVLFSFIVAGILSVAVATVQAYREQRQIMATENAVRSPMDFLADAVRSGSPAVKYGHIVDTTASASSVNCTPRGFLVTNSTSGPDQLDVTFAYGAVVTSLRTAYTTNAAITVTNPAGIFVGDQLLIADGNDTAQLAVSPPTPHGHLVTVTGISGANVTLQSQGGCVANSPNIPAYDPGALVIRALRARFYISTTCCDGIPTLMMDPDADGPAQGEPLAEGIEDFQVALGDDTDNNGTVDIWRYSAGNNTPPTGFIRAVRITLVARADSQLVKGANTFRRPAAEDRAAATVFDSYRRRVLTSTIEVRNIGASP